MHPNRHGADTRAETFSGDTPAHMAAARGHLLVLTALLQVCWLRAAPLHARLVHHAHALRARMRMAAQHAMYRNNCSYMRAHTLQAERPAKIDARNVHGVSVQELAEQAMQAQEDARWVARCACHCPVTYSGAAELASHCC